MADPRFARIPPETASVQAQHRVASFTDYLSAQRLVDRMSDDGFPVEHVRIVGDGIRTVARSMSCRSMVSMRAIFCSRQ